MENKKFKRIFTFLSIFAAFANCSASASAGDLYDPNALPANWQKVTSYITPQSTGALYIAITADEIGGIWPNELLILQDVFEKSMPMLDLRRAVNPNNSEEQIFMFDASEKRPLSYIKGGAFSRFSGCDLWIKVITRASIRGYSYDDFSEYYPIYLKQDDSGTFNLTLRIANQYRYFDSIEFTPKENNFGVMIGIKTLIFKNSKTNEVIHTQVL